VRANSDYGNDPNYDASRDAQAMCTPHNRVLEGNARDEGPVGKLIAKTRTEESVTSKQQDNPHPEEREFGP
jgi:hypothetical protein